MKNPDKDQAGVQAKNSIQAHRFAEAAKALGADEDEAAFKAKLAMIAQQRPVPVPPVEKPAKAKKPKAG